VGGRVGRRCVYGAWGGSHKEKKKGDVREVGRGGEEGEKGRVQGKRRPKKEAMREISDDHGGGEKVENRGASRGEAMRKETVESYGG